MCGVYCHLSFRGGLSKIKHLLRKKIFYYYLHTLDTQSTSHSIYLYLSMSLSPSSQSVPSLFSHSLLTFHNISSSVPSTALDIHHFLKLFKVIFGEMQCQAVVIRTDEIIHVYLLVHKLTRPQEDSLFSPQKC
jgi:hypothetical protein